MKKSSYFFMPLLALGLIGLGSIPLQADLPSNSWDIRLGYLASNIGVFSDFTTFPVQLSPVIATTRFDLGFTQISGGATAVCHVNEIFSIQTFLRSLTAYAGAGLSFPLATNGVIGSDLVVGLEQDSSFFKANTEKIFIEVGVDSYSANNQSISGSTIMAGFKFFF